MHGLFAFSVCGKGFDLTAFITFYKELERTFTLTLSIYGNVPPNQLVSRSALSSPFVSPSLKFSRLFHNPHLFQTEAVYKEIETRKDVRTHYFDLWERRVPVSTFPVSTTQADSPVNQLALRTAVCLSARH